MPQKKDNISLEPLPIHIVQLRLFPVADCLREALEAVKLRIRRHSYQPRVGQHRAYMNRRTYVSSKSTIDWNMYGITKFSRLNSSRISFCSGVPDRSTRQHPMGSWLHNSGLAPQD